MELILPQNYELINQNEAKYIIGGGSVTFRVHLSDGVKNIGIGVACGVVTGVITAAGAVLESTAPGFGNVVGGIVGAVTLELSKAIKENWKFMDISINVPCDSHRIIDLHV